MLILALETSTSNAKALLYDDKLGVIDRKAQAYGKEIYANGKALTDKVFELVLKLGREIASGKDVKAITLCGTWHSIGVFDDKIRPIMPMYSWEFLEAGKTAKEIRKDKELTYTLYSKTGCMPHVTYPRQHLYHIKKEGYDLKNRYFLSQGAYNFYRLTDILAESVSTVAGSGLLNIHNLEYDDYVMEMLGTKKEQFAPLVNYKNIGYLNDFGAKALGLQKGIIVVPAHPDGAMNQLASGANSKGKMTLSIGTSGAIRFTNDSPFIPDDHQLWCYYGADNYISGAATVGCCNCINWFFDELYKGQYTYEDLEDENDVMGDVPVFLPFIFGERCPGWNDERRDGFVDLKESHTPRDKYRAVQSGIIFNLYQCYESLSKNLFEASDIYVSGGVLNSSQWTQMLADIFNKEIKCEKVIDASSFGTIVLGMVNLGIYPTLKDYVKSEDSVRLVKPNKDRVEYYKKEYERYLYWYQETRKKD